MSAREGDGNKKARFKSYGSLDEYWRWYRKELQRLREEGVQEEKISESVSSKFDELKGLEENLKERVSQAKKDLEDTKNQLEETQRNLRATKGEMSFLTAQTGLQDYAAKIKWRALFAKATRIFLSLVIVWVLLYILRDISSPQYRQEIALAIKNYFSGEGMSFGVENDDVRPLVDLFVALKKGLVQVSMLIVGLYFYRVSLREEREAEAFQRDLEYKAAVSSFQEGHLERVKESGGKAEESIKRYEDFLYGVQGNSLEEEPKVTDGADSILSRVADIMKASNRTR